MAYNLVGFTLTLEAAADLSSSQYCAVNVDGNGKAALPSVGGRIVGVLQNDPTSGKEATIQFLGATKMVAAGAITAGAWVKVDATGKAVSTSTATDEVVGICLTAAGGANELATILLIGPGFVTLP